MAEVYDVNGLLSVNYDDLFGRTKSAESTTQGQAFGKVLDSAFQLLNDTNSLANDAQAKSIDFALGKTNSTHEMTIALQKAAVSLQYTVAIKNQLMSAYNEIMQIQI